MILRKFNTIYNNIILFMRNDLFETCYKKLKHIYAR